MHSIFLLFFYLVIIHSVNSSTLQAHLFVWHHISYIVNYFQDFFLPTNKIKLPSSDLIISIRFFNSIRYTINYVTTYDNLFICSIIYLYLYRATNCLQDFFLRWVNIDAERPTIATIRHI